MHAQDVTDVLALRDIIAGAVNTADLIAELIDWRNDSNGVPDAEIVAAQAAPTPAPKAPAKAAPAKAAKGRAKPPPPPPPADDDNEPSPDPSDDSDF